MHKEDRPRRLIVELNRDGSSGGERMDMEEWFVEDNGVETRLREYPRDASREDVEAALGKTLAAALADARGAHQKIAELQAAIRHRDNLISAKDQLINHFLSAADSERRTAEGRVNLHAANVAEYQRVVEAAEADRAGG